MYIYIMGELTKMFDKTCALSAVSFSLNEYLRGLDIKTYCDLTKNQRLFSRNEAQLRESDPEV